MPEPSNKPRLNPGDRVVCVGDSITADPEGYVAFAQQVLRVANRRVELINAGVAGQTAADMAARFEADALARRPSWVTISAGNVDAIRGVSTPEYARSVQRMIDAAREVGVNVGLCTPTPGDPTYAEGTEASVTALIAEYAAWIRQIAQEQGLLLIPMHEVFTLVQRASDASDPVRLTYDGWHPSPAGRYLMGLAFLAALGLSLEADSS